MIRPLALSLFILLLSVWGSLESPSWAQDMDMDSDFPTTDAIARPPDRQVVASPRQDYILILQTPDEWASKRVEATLYEATDDRCQPRWSQALPHEYGPRYALVSDQGQVTLLDEWINVASDYAVMVLGVDGEEIARYDFEAMRQAVDMPVDVVVERAQTGWWISAEPRLSPDGEQVRVAIGGKTLRIDLSTGQLQ